MIFDNPEVVELGLAEELVQDTIGLPNSEGTVDMSRIKTSLGIYVADAE
jgi:hypothetical protein